MADPSKVDDEQLDALAREAHNTEVLSDYQYSVLEEQMERYVQRRARRSAERAVQKMAERSAERAVQKMAERDLQRWLKYQREVGIHKAFARDYAMYMARISC